MKIKLTYTDDEKIYTHNGIKLTSENISTIIPKIFDVDNTEQYLEQLSPYEFDATMTDSHFCDCCGTYNVNYDAYWNKVEILFTESCSGKTAYHNCSNEHMKDLLIEYVDSFTLFDAILSCSEYIVLDDGSVEYSFN